MSVSTSNASSQRSSAPGSRGASPVSTKSIPDELAREIAVEQAHVDRVHEELEKAGVRADVVQAEGLARSQFGRQVEVGDAEGAALFERDALMFHAAKRRTALDTQYEGLVFGRLDIDHAMLRAAAAVEASTATATAPSGRQLRRATARSATSGASASATTTTSRSSSTGAPRPPPPSTARPRPSRWASFAVASCAAAAPTVIGVEDDLMVPEAPDDLVIVGDGALMAALTRSRGERMRDIVATIQAHQDEAIRASARGITEITGGPGTGKTVVALHRAAYLLYSDRRRFESGGILVVGPSGAYTAYIERVLPVARRGQRHPARPRRRPRRREHRAARPPGRRAHEGLDPHPHAARRRRPRPVARAPDRVPRHGRRPPGARSRPATSTASARTSCASTSATRRTAAAQDAARRGRLVHARHHRRPGGQGRVPRQVGGPPRRRGVHAGLVAAGRPARGAALARRPRARAPARPRHAARRRGRAARRLVPPRPRDRHVVGGRRRAHRRPAARLGPLQEAPKEERGFYEIEELEDLSQYGVTEVQPVVSAARDDGRSASCCTDPRDELLAGRIGKPDEYAHVLVDEAQDLSPMQWRMIGRRGRYASWTVVGDAAQASWPDATEAAAAREEAFGSQGRQQFHMDTNYRNAREIFDYAAEVVRREVPDADIPQAVRETGDGSRRRRARAPTRWCRPGGPRARCSSRSRARSLSSRLPLHADGPRSCWPTSGRTRPGDRPDVDEGPRVRRDSGRRPRRDHP